MGTQAGVLQDLICHYSGSKDGQGKSLICIGFGTDSLRAEAESTGLRFTGIDFSEDLLEDTAALRNQAFVYTQGAETLEFPYQSFDVCVLADIVEFVRDPQALIQFAWKMLKPGGILLVTALSPDSHASGLMNRKIMEFKPERLFYFNPTNLQTILYRGGFSSIRMVPYRKRIDTDRLKGRGDGPSSDSWFSRFARMRSGWTRNHFPQTAPKVSHSRVVAVATRNTLEDGNLTSLSVILPVFNEKDTFPTLMDELLEKNVPGLDIEIVIIESNSTDGTRDQVLQLEDHPKVKIVLQDAPRGKGNAVREGFEHASGDIILIQDGDLEYDLWDYEALIRPILQLRRSFTLGLRHRGGAMKMRKFIHKPVLAWIINFGHKALTFGFNVLYGQRLKDPWTMFKVFRRDCIDGIEFQCDHFDFDIELVIKLIKQGFAPIEIPVNYVSRSFSEGKKVSFVQDPIRIVKAMLKYRLIGLKS